jgi:hypothetical protein
METLETLEQIWKRLADAGYKTDKGDVHSYIPVYEKLLAPYRETALNVLEIGLFNGHSMMMWEDYFTKADIIGIDCSDQPHGGMADLRPMIDEGWDIHIFDAENVTEVSKRFFGTRFDVIIEDAGHEINQQLNLYRIWKEYLAPGGVYIIEDVQDIDRDEMKFLALSPNVEVIDNRKIKGRYDDCLVVIK